MSDATTTNAGPSFLMFHVPEDQPELLAAVGKVALLHAQLDHTLKLTLKTLSGVSIEDALDATEYETSSALRDRVKKLGRDAMGDGTALIQLQALMTRCKRVTERRNELLHSIWCRDHGTQINGVTDGLDARPLPTLDELKALATEIRFLLNVLQEARLLGFIVEAMQLKRKK
jgi:hypothetical protein